jgi:hypothetical protein
MGVVEARQHGAAAEIDHLVGFHARDVVADRDDPAAQDAQRVGSPGLIHRPHVTVAQDQIDFHRFSEFLPPDEERHSAPLWTGVRGRMRPSISDVPAAR